MSSRKRLNPYIDLTKPITAYFRSSPIQRRSQEQIQEQHVVYDLTLDDDDGDEIGGGNALEKKDTLILVSSNEDCAGDNSSLISETSDEDGVAYVWRAMKSEPQATIYEAPESHVVIQSDLNESTELAVTLENIPKVPSFECDKHTDSQKDSYAGAKQEYQFDVYADLGDWAPASLDTDYETPDDSIDKEAADMGLSNELEAYLSRRAPEFRIEERKMVREEDNDQGMFQENISTNPYFEDLYDQCKTVEHGGLQPRGWKAPARKHLTAGDKMQLKSFSSAWLVLACTERLFSTHLLDASVSSRVKAKPQETHKATHGILPPASHLCALIDKMSLKHMRISQYSQLFVDVCCAFCLYESPTMAMHGEHCLVTSGCGGPQVHKLVADQTRSATRRFIEHEVAAVADDDALAILVLQSKMRTAMTAAIHSANSTEEQGVKSHMTLHKKHMLFVLPYPSDIRRLISQAVHGKNLDNTVRPACLLLDVIKAVVCEDTTQSHNSHRKPSHMIPNLPLDEASCAATGPCPGRCPCYAEHLSSLPLQRALGLDVDWVYEPSFLEFFALLDRSVWLFEQLNQPLGAQELCAVADGTVGPAAAVDFQAALFCRFRQDRAANSEVERSTESLPQYIPLLLKVLRHEEVPLLRALRLLLFQAVRLVRVQHLLPSIVGEAAGSISSDPCDVKEAPIVSENHGNKDSELLQVCEKLHANAKRMFAAVLLLVHTLDAHVSASIYRRAATRSMLIFEEENNIKLHRSNSKRANAALCDIGSARDKLYVRLLSGLRGLCARDLYALQIGYHQIPFSNAGFVSAESSHAHVSSFTTSPFLMLLKRLTLVFSEWEHEHRRTMVQPRSLDIPVWLLEWRIGDQDMINLSRSWSLYSISQRYCLKSYTQRLEQGTRRSILEAFLECSETSSESDRTLVDGNDATSGMDLLEAALRNLSNILCLT